MTAKETRDLSIDMSILMESILDINSSSEEVANAAIGFAKQIFKQHPKIKEETGNIIGCFESNDPYFNDYWDRNIEWIKNWSK
jgi:hypothetical protein